MTQKSSKKLTDEQIEKMTFKEIIEAIEEIKKALYSNEVEVEMQLELYSKAIKLISKGREKLANIKSEKERIDTEYESFIKKLEESEN